MAGLYEKQSETYAKKRPQYPKEWFSMLAGLTAGHQRAWDAGCGTGQAAISVSFFFIEWSAAASPFDLVNSERNMWRKQLRWRSTTRAWWRRT
jgi:hypothetical protein